MKKRIVCLAGLLLLTACAGQSAAPPGVPPASPTNCVSEPTPALIQPVWGAIESGCVKTDDKTGDTVMTAFYRLPKITNAEEGASAWTAINDYYEAEIQSLLEGAQQVADTAQEGYAYCHDNGYEFYPYADEQSFELKLQTERYVSILRTHYFYQGGAHGEVCLLSDTFDMTTGEPVGLCDLFTVSPAEYEKRILTEITALAAAYQTDDGTPVFQESDLEHYFDPAGFYLTPDALVICYQACTIGTYIIGTPEFMIPRQTLEDITIKW